MNNGNWFKAKLGEIADIVGGGTPSTKDPTNFEGNIPWITPKDLANYPYRYISHGERFLSEKGLKKSAARLLPPGTVLLTSRAPVGYVAIAKCELATNQGFRSLVLKDGFDPEFVYYLLEANRELLESHASGSTFKELSGSVLKNIEFPFPSLPEQKAIAHILGTLDDKIELNQRMNETLEEMARAIFKSWFVDFDPVIDNALKAGNPIPDALAEKAARRRAISTPKLSPEIARLFPDSFEDSPLGPIPKGWRVSSFTKIIEINPKYSLSKGKIAPYVDMASLPTSGLELLSPPKLREFTSGSKFKNGDVLFARITPCLENDKTTLVNFLEEGQIGWGSTEFLVFSPKKLDHILSIVCLDGKN